MAVPSSAVPSISVPLTPSGWTHIGGPGMQLLIGLHEDDALTHAASDAADTGDFDSVIDVLVSRGTRNAPPFAGVTWDPVTRVVAFGTAAVTVVDTEGGERLVRAASARVWTDEEVDPAPERVVMHPVDPNAHAAPVTVSGHPDPVTEHAPAHLPAPATPPAPIPDSAPAPAPASRTAATTAPVTAPQPADAPEPAAEPHIANAALPPVRVQPVLPPTPSPWSMSWAQEQAQDTPETQTVQAIAEPAEPPTEQATADDTPDGQPKPPAQPEPPAQPAPAVPAWGARAPMQPRRAQTTTPPQATTPPQPATPSRTEIDSPPVTEPVPTPTQAPAHTERAVQHTLAGRPELPAEDLPSHEADPTDLLDPTGPLDSPGPGDHGPHPSSGDPAPAGATPTQGPPDVPASYDYLFGHTSDAEEHRRLMESLNPEASADDPDHTGGDTVTPPAGEPAALSDSSAQPEQGPQPPVWNADAAAPPEPGGLISAVPWARPRPAPAAASAPDTRAQASPPSIPPAAGPVYGGRTSPPPAPALIPMPPSPSQPPVTSEQTPELAPESARTPDPEPAPQAGAHTPEAPEPAPEATGAPAEVGGIEERVEIAQEEPAEEATVDRGDLLAARDEARRQAGLGPTVVAVLCSLGHPSPAHAVTCRICGQPIPVQEPFEVARPSMGTLRLSTGDVVELDRNVVIGRAPTVDESMGPAQRPNVVRVPSPERDISRNHVEIIVEGWNVLVRDLGTVNGTTLTLPGEQPVRLRANDSVPLEPGSSVTMAEDISMRYEVGE